MRYQNSGQKEEKKVKERPPVPEPKKKGILITEGQKPKKK